MKNSIPLKLLQRQFSQMKPGMACRVERAVFEEAYPCKYPNGHMEVFLASMPGSAWGVWRVRVDHDGAYIVTKHEEGGKRVFVESDRAHLFQRLPDGTLEFIGNEE